MSASITAQQLRDACEQLLCEAEVPDDVTVRRIAQRAGANVAAINYHFGSLEKLIFEVGERVYLRLNAERLALLAQALGRGSPPDAGALIAALVGPSIRWSLDPQSSYRVLRHMTTIAQASHHPEIFRPMVEDVEHHRMFIPHFRAVAPGLSEVDIGFRISCVLGVRSQIIRNRHRTEMLTGHAIDLGNADIVLEQVVAATAPMFTSPACRAPIQTAFQ
ncbi:TetR/AcrR family transcriptional regulator [Chelatococcus asaccharovorans]|uniref:TetR family transcriptional regulator n=1 Tax=Chelatococcus asaccharovorans TaxID=28210 RepID=A0A2V3U3V9_9HYPH|nr:TetR/AcrR family transcriptional regulator [Chelatococcus asaccharovorans]MBS7703054.1 TetR/AcrR family transcriptional regulator [Chelatococcus asaccharovorans]PXW57353.1 TetR family transcriptional regulator [Chelatococcus asaccharovorans]CAH1673629.1 TetR family transcriptional regulator [Chelatococcus asaccharovorans]CAH1674964.1 TetR family transcriptional regulator [Chelatococcus asaccharovorans]